MNETRTIARMTRQRRIILEELRKTTSHPTADDLYEVVRKRLPRISLGTVYRNLDVLSRKGFITRLELGGSQYRFDGNVHDHSHIRCVECGCVADLMGIQVNVPTPAQSQVQGFEVLGHRFEYVGVCPKCRLGNGARY